MTKQVVDSSNLASNGSAGGGILSDAGVSKYGASSLLFNGTSNFARFGAADHFSFGTGDFTISFWVKTTQSVTGQASFPRIISPWGALNLAGTLQLWYGSGSPTSTIDAIELAAPTGLPVTVSTVDAVNDGNWHHVAFARQAGTSRSFLDGVLKQSAADTNSYTRLATEGFLIGSRADFNALTFFSGNLDDLHISNVARYTATFTPPASEETPDANTLLLLRGSAIDGNRFASTYLGPVIDNPVSGPVTFKQDTQRGQKVIDLYWGGNGRVAGTLKVKGTPDIPVRRRVRLFRERDGFCIGETWSDATTGAYEFLYVDPTQRYTVLAYDGPRVYRATLQDNVLPEAYP